MSKALRGFTLVELMVTLAVAALLIALGVPSLSQFMTNSKVLAASEAFYAAVQQARTEAIRRNEPVEVILTDASPVAGSANTTSATTSGPNWIVRTAPVDPGADRTFITGKSGSEGGGKADATTSLVISASSGSVRFNATGALVGGTAVTVNFGDANNDCEPSGSTRCLRVVVATGGQARMCDPQVGAADSRRC